MIYHANGHYTMGDIMMVLNLAHMRAHMDGVDIHLKLYWEHPKERKFHFEDPELAYERCDYIHKFYKDSDKVTIEHIFGVGDDRFLKEFKIVTDEQFKTRKVKDREGIFADYPMCSRLWLFNEDMVDTSPTRNKIVIWRPTFNKRLPREWKLVLTHEEWDIVIDKFKSMGYDVVELTYRTPISEAFYHCRTCEYAFFYDGMWHMMTAMMFKPSVVLGSSSIAVYNTINAIPVRTVNEAMDLVDNWHVQKSWDRVKSDGRGGWKDLQRFTSPKSMSGREWVSYYNSLSLAILYKAFREGKDWTRRCWFKHFKKR